MIRILIALAAMAGLAHAAGPIDLDIAGNLEAVQRERPEHYAKIERILAEAPKRAMDTKGVARWLQTDFAATDISYTDLVMTSLPPKKRLEFTLDNTSYTKIVTQGASAGPMAVGVVQKLAKAARAGDCEAARRLGDVYKYGGDGITRDAVESAKWYNAARTLGCTVPLDNRR